MGEAGLIFLRVNKTSWGGVRNRLAGDGKPTSSSLGEPRSNMKEDQHNELLNKPKRGVKPVGIKSNKLQATFKKSE